MMKDLVWSLSVYLLFKEERQDIHEGDRLSLAKHSTTLHDYFVIHESSIHRE